MAAPVDPTAPKGSEPWPFVAHADAHLPKLETPDVASPPVSDAMLVLGAVVAVVTILLLYWTSHRLPAVAPHHLPWWAVTPFVVLLVSLSVLPFLVPVFWENAYALICVALGAAVAAYYVLYLHADGEILANVEEFVQFLTLVGGLFIISGGMAVRLEVRATPANNVLFLLAGALLANVLGTTGAGILLIRPWLHLNRGRVRPYHIIFFIFIVANIGGVLSPLGDPPLLLGYIAGVPFWWYAVHCWPAWLVAMGVLLAIFSVVDHRSYKRFRAAAPPSAEPHAATQLRLLGAINLPLLAVLAVGVMLPSPWRELVVVACAVLSLKATPISIHQHNRFSFAPVKEVGFIFLGIFLTMTPALDLLANAGGTGVLDQRLNTPAQYYFLTGGLSSVLDNAPTFMAALDTRLGQLRARRLGPVAAVDRPPKLPPPIKTNTGAASGLSRRAFIRQYIDTPALSVYLLAISLGAVFFGAATYIGNAPNYMIRSISRHAGVKCPSFIGYIGIFTVPVLLPVLILIGVLFLRRGG